MSETLNVGQKIGTIRQQKSIGIDELAERSGLTAAMLDQIENREIIPSLGHLIKVARALGVRLGTFLDRQFGQGHSVVNRFDGSAERDLADHDQAAAHRAFQQSAR